MTGRYHLNPYQLHKHLINEYVLKNTGSTTLLKRDDTNDKTDYDVIQENHQFIWKDDECLDTWEKKLARKYFDKLFKEYAISDLTMYKHNKLGLRWRIEKEIITGKGQFICGDRKCDNRTELRSWEVNFSYIERGEKKNTLVKLRLCHSCSEKLNYRTKKREIKRIKSFRKKEKQGIDKSDNGRCSISKDKGENLEIPSVVENPVHHKAETTINESLERNCWKKETNIEDKSREEEFDGYLEELLL